jgi:hypothetical protein
MMKRYLKRTVLILLLILFLTACSMAPPAQNPGGSGDATLSAATVMPIPTEVETPTLEPTESVTEDYLPCANQWATQALPEISDKLLQAFKDSGLNDIKVRAEAYGENCVDSGSGKVRSFSTLETDFRISLPVTDLADQQALGAAIEQILPILDQFPVGSVPGPQPGYIGIGFTHGNGTLNLWFMRIDAAAARMKGLTGADLFRALSK